MKDKYLMTVSDNILYAKRNIVDSIYSEARLEGIEVTYPDTQEIYEGRTVAGLSVEDTIKINNLKHAWRFIMNNIDCSLDLRFIQQVNAEVGKGIVMNEGNIRTLDVKIGGTSWRPEIPDETKVRNDILSFENNKSVSVTQKAIDVMLYIMRSQLFMDGNKRTAQIVANKIMISGGAGIINIPVEKQKAFLDHLIVYYKSDNSSAISEFVYNNCIDGVNMPQHSSAISIQCSNKH